MPYTSNEIGSADEIMAKMLQDISRPPIVDLLLLLSFRRDLLFTCNAQGALSLLGL
jgi:hypothetical protein